MQRLAVELGLALERHEMHARPLHRLGDCLGVDIVVLVALHEGPHILRRHQPHIVPLPGQDPAKIMGAAARLHPDPAGRQGRRQNDESPPGHAATKHGPALGVLADEVEHRLAEIDAERCYGHGYLLLELSLQRKGSHPAPQPPRPAYLLGLHLRRHLSQRGQGRRPCHAVLQQHDHGDASGRDIAGRGTRRPAVLLMDQAGWHSSAKLDVPDNITIVLFPSRSPELNPVENVWQFLRDNWLSNRVFTSHDDIVDHCCEAWNKLVDRPWTIMSIGMRDWAYRS